MLWRPLRVATSQHLVKPLLEQTISSAESRVTIAEGGGVGFQLHWNSRTETESISYRPPAGFFFLLATVSMVFLTSKLRFFVYLLGFHLAAFLLVLALLIPAAWGYVIFFHIADLISSYLVPVLSMACIPWLIYLKRKKTALS